MTKTEGKESSKRDFLNNLVAYVVVIYVATLSYLLVDARMQLMEADSNAADSVLSNVVAMR